jgi:hypothetical protein
MILFDVIFDSAIELFQNKNNSIKKSQLGTKTQLPKDSLVVSDQGR